MRRWLRDTYVISAMEFKRLIREWAAFFITSLISAATFFLFRLAVNPPLEVELRLLAGAIVFGVGMQSINSTGQIMVSERFEGQMKLFRTSPVSQGSYVVGVTVFAATAAILSAFVVLGLAALAGVDYYLSPLLPILLITTSLALPGFAVLIATHARTAQGGYMLCNTVGIIVVFISPIFYPIERLPEWLQWIARISPFTHAGKAFTELLSGGSDIIVPLAILVAFMIITNVLGITRMRWREP
jgi:ABC-type multidrug transport system permease subunit